MSTGFLNKSVAFAGIVVQTVNTQDGEVATGTATIPLDDTIPQNTEGTEFITASITPTSATNLLRIDVGLVLHNSGTNIVQTAALFQDSTASALMTAVANYQAGSSGDRPISMTYWMTAGTVSSTTFKIRAGGHGASTTSFNGRSGVRRFGGTFISSITITEYKI